MFTVDGVQWDVPCTISRVASLTASQISGMLLDKSYFNDVLGTWFQYNITMVVPIGQEADYNAIYEVLTDPVESHVFVLPYADTTIEITGRIVTVSDVYVREGNVTRWRKTAFSIISNYPSKTLSLDEVISYGKNPFPDSIIVEEGDIYEYTEDGWVKIEYENADDMYF